MSVIGTKVLTNEEVGNFSIYVSCEAMLGVGNSRDTRKAGFGGITDFNSSEHIP